MNNHEKVIFKHNLDMANIDLMFAIQKLEESLNYNDSLENLILQLCNIKDELKNLMRS